MIGRCQALRIDRKINTNALIFVSLGWIFLSNNNHNSKVCTHTRILRDKKLVTKKNQMHSESLKKLTFKQSEKLANFGNDVPKWYYLSVRLALIRVILVKFGWFLEKFSLFLDTEGYFSAKNDSNKRGVVLNFWYFATRCACVF